MAVLICNPVTSSNVLIHIIHGTFIYFSTYLASVESTHCWVFLNYQIARLTFVLITPKKIQEMNLNRNRTSVYGFCKCADKNTIVFLKQ